jgi:hypothetical protein
VRPSFSNLFTASATWGIFHGPLIPMRALPGALLDEPSRIDVARGARHRAAGKKDQRGQYEKNTRHGRTSKLLHYSAALRNRRALVMTETELRLIAALASIGLRTRPNTG